MQTTNPNDSGSKESRSNTALVFDIGGTTIRAGVFDNSTGSLGPAKRVATPNFQTHSELGARELLEKVIEAVTALARDLLGGDQPSVVVVGYPGPVLPSGVVLRSPTILGPALDCECNIKARLQEGWPGAEIRVLNDLSCAGYAYVAQGHRDFCVITVGSGIGNKVFLDGRPVTGPSGRGGEIGHLQLFPGERAPHSARRDELGNIASGRGAINLCRQFVDEYAGKRIVSDLLPMSGDELSRDDGSQLARAFRMRDELAVRIVETSCYPLAQTIAAMHLAIGLESFFIVGGFAKALGRDYLDILIRYAQELTWDLGQDWKNMISLGNEDVEEALVGAAHVVANTSNKNNCELAEGGL